MIKNEVECYTTYRTKKPKLHTPNATGVPIKTANHKRINPFMSPLLRHTLDILGTVILIGVFDVT